MSRKHSLLIAALPLTLTLAACGLEGTDRFEEEGAETAAAEGGDDLGYDTYGDDNWADSMASDDSPYLSRDGAAMGDAEGVNGNGDMAGATAPGGIPDSEERPIMQAQVVLDRNGFGPGVIDGRMGMSTRNALEGFQEANDLEVTGEMDTATEAALERWSRIPATRVVTIPASWGELDFQAMPDDPEAQSQMAQLGYQSLDEKLAERFHTTVAVLRELNPGGRPAGAGVGGTANASPAASPSPTASATSGNANSATRSTFRAGQQIRVPNIGGDRIAPDAIADRGWQQTLASLGVGSEQPQVDRIVVSKSASTLKAYQGDRLVAMFTVTSGSSRFPLPLGEWDILGEAYNPPYSYDPAVLGRGEGETFRLPPGPNSPVGVVWIDLSREHYGIHGTPDPETIGRAQSSGCVRLTNWDAARVAGMVSQNTQVLFEA